MDDFLLADDALRSSFCMLSRRDVTPRVSQVLHGCFGRLVYLVYRVALYWLESGSSLEVGNFHDTAIYHSNVLYCSSVNSAVRVGNMGN